MNEKLILRFRYDVSKKNDRARHTRLCTLKLEYSVSDYNGTLALNGKMPEETKQRLSLIANSLKIIVLTSDEFGKAAEELKGVNCELKIIEEREMDIQKAEFVKKLGAEKVVALGNGMNDRKMLKVAGLGIAVLGSEGASSQALAASDIQVASACIGLDLLLNPRRVRATLKY